MAFDYWDVDVILFIDYLEQGQSTNSDGIVQFETGNREKTTPYKKEQSALLARQCTISQLEKNDGKIINYISNCFRTLHFVRFSFHMSADLKKMLARKRFKANLEVIAYFVDKNYFIYKKSIEML